MSFHLGTVRILSQVWLSTGLKKAFTSNPKLYYTTSLVNGAILEKLQTKESMFTFFSTAAVHRCKSKIGVKGPITRTVLLVDENGQNQGLIALKEAINIARTKSLELVEVKRSSGSGNEYTNSVFKLISSKTLFDNSVKKRKQQKVRSPKLKEIVITGRIAPQDLKWKVKRIREFLEDSHPVKLSVTHTSRKSTSVDEKLTLIGRIQEEVKDIGILEGEPKAAGNFRIKCVFKSVSHK